MISKQIIILLLLLISSTALHSQDPLFPNSVVSNNIDFIRDSDSDTFVSLVFLGLADKEMPSSISNELFDEDTFVFEAAFSDGEIIEIWCHSSFITLDAAQEYAEKLCPRLGKLPVFQRNMLNHVVIHNGDAGAFAEIQGQFFVLYSDNMNERISTNDLEETVFHESVHASYQFMYQNHPSWLDAQSSDSTFVTEYGQDNPTLEDMAETAIFAYTLFTFPGRLSLEIEDWLNNNIPHRLEWFRMLYPGRSQTSDLEFNDNIFIHPNPSSGEFIIESDDISSGDIAYVFYLSTGRFVKSFTGTKGNINIDLKEYANGVYLISIKERKTLLIKQ